MLPNKSQSSMLKGVWFVCEDGINSIKIHGSAIGKETIYLNGEIISEQINLSKTSEHLFDDNSGNIYKVNFNCLDMFKGIQECTITRNDKIIRSFHTKFVKANNNRLVRLVIVIFISIIFTAVKIYWNWPEYSMYIFLILILIAHFYTKKADKIEITEF